MGWKRLRIYVVAEPRDLHLLVAPLEPLSGEVTSKAKRWIVKRVGTSEYTQSHCPDKAQIGATQIFRIGVNILTFILQLLLCLEVLQSQPSPSMVVLHPMLICHTTWAPSGARRSSDLIRQHPRNLCEKFHPIPL